MQADFAVDAIDRRRKNSLSKLIGALHSILEDYQGVVVKCTPRCDAILLGSLTKSMKSIQVLILPEVSSHNVSFKSLAERVQAMEIFTDFQRPARFGENACAGKCKSTFILPFQPPHFIPIYSATPRVKSAIKDIVRELEIGLCGLDFDAVQSGRLDQT